MNKPTTLLFAGILACVSFLNVFGQSCVNNLLTNSGFENGLTGWSVFSGNPVASSASPYTGNKSLEMGGVSGQVYYVNQSRPATPNTTYNFTFYARLSSPGSFILQCRLKFYTSSWLPVSGNEYLMSNIILYEPHTLSGVAPSNAAYVGVEFQYSTLGTDKAFVDELCLTVSQSGTNSCPGNLVQNPGFETGTASSWNVGIGIPGATSFPVTDTHSGSHALRMKLTNISQQIQLVPGKQYTLKAWAKADVGNTTSAYLHFNIFSNTAPILGVLTYITSTTYQAYEVAFVAPANAATANALVTTNDMYVTVDDFCVTESTPTCAITATASNIQCNDNGTPNLATDDYFTYDITAQQTGNCGTGWFLGSTPYEVIPYGTALTTGPQIISSGPSVLGIRDAVVQTTQYTLTVQQPPTCSNGGGSGQIDLSLVAQQLTSFPAQWSNYPVKLTLNNAGPQAATSVKVKFAKPTGVVYVGGNEFTASQGMFTPNGDQVWTVGNIPANGSATLTVNYFLLNASAPVAYAQVTAHNETDSDSQPNNGTPPTPVQDDEASTAGGSGPTPQPDLTITDLQIPNASVAAGAILSYNFDAGNAGTAAVPGNFTIKSYISTDQTLSANDIQDGTIQTGNYGVGFSVQNVAGASTIPASLAAGSYFLIVKIDADNVVSESSENNNIVIKAFTVTPGQPVGCEKKIGTGEFVCTSLPQANQLQVLSRTFTQPYQYTRTTLDANGLVIGTPESVAVPDPYYLTFSSNALWKVNQTNGTLIYSKPMPATLLSNYILFSNAAEFSNGYILFAYKRQEQANLDSLFAIRTDANLNPLASKFLFPGGHISYNGVSSALQIAPDRVAFFLRKGTAVGSESLNLVVIDNNLYIKSNNEWMPTGYFSQNASLQESPCSGFSVVTNIATAFCIHGACSIIKEEFGEFENDMFRIRRSWLSAEQSTYGQGTQIKSWATRLSDGSTVIGDHSQSIPLTMFPVNDTVRLTKKLNELTIWVKKVVVPGASYIKEIREVGGNLVFIKSVTTMEELRFVSLACLEGGTPPPPPPPAGDCNAITITAGAGQITIAGFSAPHVLIKVFRPNWTVAYECLDGQCASPTVVTGLGAGTHHIQVKLIDNNWQEICFLQQSIGVTNIALPDDERLRLNFDKFYPNPTAYLTTIELYSPIAQQATLDFYDRTGRLVHTQKVELEQGQNLIEQLVFDWKSGTYNVMARGEQSALPAYGRFLKIWEE
jgi:hypothetical protein